MAAFECRVFHRGASLRDIEHEGLIAMVTSRFMM